MHKNLKPLIAALLLSSPLLAMAVEEHHPEQASAPAVTEQMNKMQAIHDKIAAAKTPEERASAMREGMLAMKDSLGMMQSGCAGAAGGQQMNMMMMDSNMMKMMMQMMDQQAGMMGPQSGMGGMHMQGMPMQAPAEKPAQ